MNDLITIPIYSVLGQWVSAFLLDRKAQHLSPHTVKFYRVNLSLFASFCSEAGAETVQAITPEMIRRFLLGLEADHNAGGVHGHYRAVRSFLLWYEVEDAPPGWTNPISKVKAPRQNDTQLEPVSLDAVRAMMSVCPAGLVGLRDRGAMLFLLDTGARAQEACDVDVSDCNLITGEVLIRKGKGGKARHVYLGESSRKILRTYMRLRTDDVPALFVGRNGRLTYSGLSQIIERRAVAAHLEPRPTPHSFRRAFALICLRAGMDVYALQRLMGHEDLHTLMRYLKLTDVDLETAHRLASPVDNWRL